LHDESCHVEIDLSLSESALDRGLARRRTQEQLRLIYSGQSGRHRESADRGLGRVGPALIPARGQSYGLKVKQRLHLSILAPG